LFLRSVPISFPLALQGDSQPAESFESSIETVLFLPAWWQALVTGSTSFLVSNRKKTAKISDETHLETSDKTSSDGALTQRKQNIFRIEYVPCIQIFSAVIATLRLMCFAVG
jgi:hypothetical protein